MAVGNLQKIILKKKNFLILEKDRYKFAKALSDLAGVDIRNHRNDPPTMVEVVRHWFASIMHTKRLVSEKIIWDDFNVFIGHFEKERKKQGLSRRKKIYSIPTIEFIGYIKRWLRKKRRE